MRGAELIFTMGASPNKNWAQKPENRPYSENGEGVTKQPYIQSGDQLFLKSTKISLACETADAEIRYTLNGPEPDKNSELYRSPLEIHKTTLLKMKAFHSGVMTSIPVEVLIRKAELNDAILISDLSHGLVYDYFERFFVQATDLELVKPLSNGVTPNFNIQMARIPSYFGLWFRGYIKVPADGIYTFHLSSNDGSHLYLDGKELIENEG